MLDPVTTQPFWMFYEMAITGETNHIVEISFPDRDDVTIPENFESIAQQHGGAIMAMYEPVYTAIRKRFAEDVEDLRQHKKRITTTDCPFPISVGKVIRMTTGEARYFIVAVDMDKLLDIEIERRTECMKAVGWSKIEGWILDTCDRFHMKYGFAGISEKGGQFLYSIETDKGIERKTIYVDAKSSKAFSTDEIAWLALRQYIFKHLDKETVREILNTEQSICAKQQDAFMKIINEGKAMEEKLEKCL